MVQPGGRTLPGLQMKQQRKTVIQNEEQHNVDKVKNGRNAREIKCKMGDLAPSMDEM
jgi:hypothetical protein